MDELGDLEELATQGEWARLFDKIRVNPELARAKNAFGSTLLIRLAPFKNAQLVALLLDHGADPNVVDLEGHSVFTSLMESREETSGHLEILDLLLRSGLDANLRAYNDWTPLHTAAAWHLPETARRLMRAGADLSARDRLENETPLDIATRFRDDEIAQILTLPR
jgi:ankyrin repeat protein